MKNEIISNFNETTALLHNEKKNMIKEKQKEHKYNKENNYSVKELNT